MEVISSSVRKKENMGMEETELRLGLGLGLPGKGRAETELVRKRGFSESESESNETDETTVDLKLNLSSTTAKPKEKTLLPNDPAKPPAKAQVVGWPPVRSYRKNIMKSSNNGSGSGKEEAESEKGSPNANANGSFVKVSMDGAPYLRKVDLNIYSSYQHLSDALAKMFGSFTLGNCGAQGMKDFMNESKLMNLLNSSDYVPTYEDKDGDWMLVGDVPWEMFVESCKRLRIMKGKEAIGLAPRAMEKCKNRS